MSGSPSPKTVVGDEFDFSDVRQNQIAALLWNDSGLYKKYAKLFNEVSDTALTDFNLKMVIEIYKKQVEKFGDIPSVDYLSQYCLEKVFKDKPDQFVKFLDLMKPLKNSDEFFLKKELGEFFKAASYIKLMNFLTETELDYGLIDKQYEYAKRLNDGSWSGWSAAKCYDFLLNKTMVKKCTSGFKELDKILNKIEGCPVNGQILCYMGDTGAGKTHALVNAAVANAEQGLNVGFISLEMGIKDIMGRVGSRITGFSYKELIEKKPVINLQNLMVWSISEFDIYDLEAFLYEYEVKEKKKLDVLVIDYFELIGCTTSDNDIAEYERQTKISEKLHQIAEKHEMLIITATQANRETKDNKAMDMNRAAGSYGKMRIMEYIVTMQADRGFEGPDKNIGKLKFHIAKTRYGQNYVTCTSLIDYSKSKFMFTTT